MLDSVEDGSEREGVAVVVEVAHGHDVSDHSSLDEQRGDPPCGCPATVLVDRQSEAEPLRFLDELARGVEILCERLLGEDVLSGGEGRPDERGAHAGMCCDVDDLDLRMLEELGEIVEDRLDAVGLPHAHRRLGTHVVHAHDPLPVPRIARKVRRPHDPAASHNADARTVALRERRLVVEVQSVHPLCCAIWVVLTYRLASSGSAIWSRRGGNPLTIASRSSTTRVPISRSASGEPGTMWREDGTRGPRIGWAAASGSDG